jgi:hypothetical protein
MFPCARSIYELWAATLVSWVTSLRALYGPTAVLAFFALASVLLAILFWLAKKYVIPILIAYVQKQLNARVRFTFANKGLSFIGFRPSTTAISFILGATFYILVKIALLVPLRYWEYTLSLLACGLIAVTVIGYFVSGKVPDQHRTKYWIIFQIPTLTAIGLGLINFSADFVIHFAAALLAAMQMS